MKTNLLQMCVYCAVALGMGSLLTLAAATEDSADTAPATTAIPWSQLGAKAGADYQGHALAVIPTAEGARLSCAFATRNAVSRWHWRAPTPTSPALQRPPRRQFCK